MTEPRGGAQRDESRHKADRKSRCHRDHRAWGTRALERGTRRQTQGRTGKSVPEFQQVQTMP